MVNFKNISTVLIWSQDFKSLAEWYKTKFDFQVVEELDHPLDTGVLFKVGNVNLWIGQHSEVNGKNKDIHRHMFNIDVDSVTEAYKHLKSRGVTFFAKPFKAPTFDKYFATFYDLDDNLVQLIGKK